MDNDLVRYSRAGDVFHYRWAARRCLRMINPKSKIKYLTIEGSKESKRAGEYVIDVAEYAESVDGNQEDVAYFQLKHSTKRAHECFHLSDLKDTVVGFSKRFIDHEANKSTEVGSVTFTIITNRPINSIFKDGVQALAKGEEADKRFQKTLEKYTKLKGHNLKEFCGAFYLIDSEGDYIDQHYELKFEISQMSVGTNENAVIDSLVALAQNEALPNAKRKIVPEDILKRFGVSSKRDLFPAPTEFENLNISIQREQHAELLDCIIQASTPVIIHAGGGVGKTVVCRQLANSLPAGSVGIVYDCFGAGEYLNRSKPRHRCRDALIQIANEMAVMGLCETLIPSHTVLDDALLRAFLDRLDVAGKSLQLSNPNVFLAIFIDAADNAEMAAQEFSESCFVHQLLREPLSSGCRIVALCRTERVELLKPLNSLQKIELSSFSETESQSHLRTHFSSCNEDDVREFHRLTTGNPRVQANALSLNGNTLKSVLTRLGPSGMTVNEQISSQLDRAIGILKDNYPQIIHSQIDAICLGLANLHPFIPIEVLAVAADVDIATIKSFVADLGRPLWMSENSVQFRDEPTETWFRQTFSASTKQISAYVNRLEPLATSFPYVAEILPILLLKAGNYAELIRLALSDELLPESNPIDKRNVRVYRLQFAFKAALREKRYADAAKLALRAGEEMAGDKRQLELLSKNTDLIAPLQSAQRVQELAFRRWLRSAWTGSENVYSAALLSTVEDFKGEARSFLRAANNWLSAYFDERKTSTDNPHHEKLRDEDVLELALTNLNLFGTKGVVEFVQSWQPSEVIFLVTQLLIRRLVDAGKFTAIDEIAHFGRSNPYLISALSDELLAVGKFPPKDVVAECLLLLSHESTRIEKQDAWHTRWNAINLAIISVAETGAAYNLCPNQIQLILNHYVSIRASVLVSSDHSYDVERGIFLRATALRVVLSGEPEPDLDSLMPQEWLDKKNNHDKEQDLTRFRQVVGSLLPWYQVRVRVLASDKENFAAMLQGAEEQSKNARLQRWREYDYLPSDINQIHFEILMFNRSASDKTLKDFITQIADNKQDFPLNHLLNVTRAAFRLEHLFSIKTGLEQSCREIISSATNEYSETRADWYIALARAVLSSNPDDAKVYFDDAVEAVSKFGDEIVERWQALVAMAKRTAEGGHVSPELAYRFIRCSELIGDNVAREKYFDRNDAVEVCFKLHPQSAFASLSRWRDRDVGRLDRQLPALAFVAVQSGFICPSVGWSLSAFSWEYDFAEFAKLCIEKELNTERRKYIFDSAIKALRFKDTSESTWHILNELGQKLSLENSELQDILDFYSTHQGADNREKIELNPSQPNYLEESPVYDWEQVFANLDLMKSKGISNAKGRLDALPGHRRHDSFWQELYQRIPENQAIFCLVEIVNAEGLGSFDVQNAISKFPKAWRQKASVIRDWPKIIQATARRFASEYSNFYSAKHFINYVLADDNAVPWINEGILEGLADSCDLVDAGTLFGFANVVAAKISSHEAADLLDFALARFEQHIDDDYADGNWADWMMPPDNISEALTGFVWSALGSPRSEIRWRAAHCVRRLAEAECVAEIDELVNWMKQDRVAAFGSYKYPFYNLHARQYLLIAIARVAMDNPNLFKKHYAVFSYLALEGMPHVLIKKYAAEIALSIVGFYSDIDNFEVIEKLRQVNKSPFPVQKIEGHGNPLFSPWYERKEIDKNLKLHFSYDFDRYWFDPLGDVFGISSHQVEELAREVVINEWNVQVGGEYIRDPRQNLWRSNRSERETWHSHGSYPIADEYSFYLSYHAMLSVGAKLIQVMPLVNKNDWHEDEWQHWLSMHSLTRSDDRWLADRRDPVPLERSCWLQEKNTADWRWQISPDDFIGQLVYEKNGETWLRVGGYWSDNDGDREEQFLICSALVSPESSSSLLNALSTCSNPHDFKLPDYAEEDFEIDEGPFQLKGWLNKQSRDSYLDELDPYSGGIEYPPYKIGESFIQKFNLSTDNEQREWFLLNVAEASLATELWGYKERQDREIPARRGNRIVASTKFLKTLCATLKREIIIEIQIERRIIQKSYSSGTGEEVGYVPPYFKLFIFSKNGQLRDTGTYYQLG